MKKILTTILGVGVLIPGFALAMDPFDRYIDENDIEISSEGSIYNETSASASSGGQTASAGQSVTDGDVSAESHTTTYINANGEDSTVYVKTEVSENGETKTEEYTKEIESGESVKVHVSAEASSDGSETEVIVNEEALSADASTTMEVEAETESDSGIEKALKAVPHFFKKIIGFFWEW